MAAQAGDAARVSGIVSLMWLDRYMEIPFKDRGRDFSGADCFGFYLLLLAHEAKIEINDPNVSYGRNPNAVLRAIEAEIASARWKMIAAGDGAAIRNHAAEFDLVKMSGHLRIGGWGVDWERESLSIPRAHAGRCACRSMILRSFTASKPSTDR